MQYLTWICLESWKLDYYVLLQIDPESLFGGSIREAVTHISLIEDWSSPPGKVIGRDTHGLVRKGHPTSQPDQPNQPWRSMGWQMLQPDHPQTQEILLCTLELCLGYWQQKVAYGNKVQIAQPALWSCLYHPSGPGMFRTSPLKTLEKREIFSLETCTIQNCSSKITCR